MNLSNKKIKYIKRQIYQKTPEEIARTLHLNVKDVRKVLGISSNKIFSKIAPMLDGMFHWGIIGFAFCAPFIVLRTIPDYADLPKLLFIQIGVLFFFLIFLIRCWIKKKMLIRRSPLYMPIFVFILWSLISLFYARNTYEGFILWLNWASSALMFFLVINIFNEAKWIVRLLVMIFSSGCLCAMIGIAQHLLKFSWIPQVVAPSSTFANKNMAVHFIILTIPLGIGFILRNKRQIWGWILSAVLSILMGLMLAFLIFTKTRAGWIALIVEFLFFISFCIKGRRHVEMARSLNFTMMFMAALAVITILMMINMGPGGLKKGFKEISARAATIIDFTQGKPNGRFTMWRNTMEMIKDNFWVGKGLGNHKVFYPLYHQKIIKDTAFNENTQLVNVHNDFLQVFAELGIVGVLILGWILFWMIKMIINTYTWPYNYGIIVGIIGILVNACFSFPFQCAIPPFIFMIFLGMLGSLYSPNAQKEPYCMISRRLIPIIGLIVILALIKVIQFHYGNLKFEQDLPLLHFLEKEQKWEKVILVGEKMYQYNPHRSRKLSLIVGEAYNRMGNYSKSIEVLQEMITDYPYCLNALLNIGAAYYHMGNSKNALKAFNTVLRIKPDYYKAYNNIAKAYTKEKNFSKAFEAYKKAAQLASKKNYLIHFDAGIAATRAKDYQYAAEAFTKVIQLNPKYYAAHRNLGILYFRFLNKEQEGVYHLKKALEINPGIENAAQIQRMIELYDKGKAKK